MICTSMFKKLTTSKKIILLPTLWTIIVVIVFCILTQATFFVNWYKSEKNVLYQDNNYWEKQLYENYDNEEVYSLDKSTTNKEKIKQGKIFLDIVFVEGNYYIAREIENSFEMVRVNHFIDVQYRLFLILLTLSLLIGIVSYIIWRHQANRILEPLINLTKYIEDIQFDKLDQKIPFSWPPTDEITIISKVLQKSLHTIWQQTKQLSSFVEHAAHELKTPLMAMQSSLDVAQRKKNWDKVVILEKHINWLTRLTDQLLVLSRPSNTMLSKKNIVIYPIVDQTILLYKDHYPHKVVEIDIDEKVTIWAIPDTLNSIINNLLSNAYKYSNEKWTIHIAANNTFLSVHNTWSYLSPDEVRSIWTPFWKKDTSRSELDSIWLWLAIIKTLIQHNNWSIDVTSSEESGTTFTIIW